MRPFQLFSLLLIPLSFGVAQTAPTAPAKSAASQRFSIDNIDKTADPCTDFYQYACGNWLKNTEIPADQSSWVSFIELDERNQFTMRDILDKAAVAKPDRDAITQKIGDFYSSCMDEKAADARGSDPIKPELERIALNGNGLPSHDYKSALQEKLQAIGRQQPSYVLVNQQGPEHSKTFTVEARLQALDTESRPEFVGRAQGSTKKNAEQDAARQVLEYLVSQVNQFNGRSSGRGRC